MINFQLACTKFVAEKSLWCIFIRRVAWKKTHHWIGQKFRNSITSDPISKQTNKQIHTLQWNHTTREMNMVWHIYQTINYYANENVRLTDKTPNARQISSAHLFWQRYTIFIIYYETIILLENKYIICRFCL